jgi:tetratricopeptide (TPR) repeat protein
VRTLAVALGLAFSACAAKSGSVPQLQPAPHAESAPAPRDKVADLSARVAAHPRLYPAWAQLAEAHLERARLTHDPSDVDAARTALETSLGIQENYEALKLATALANFRHRFAEALAFGARATLAYPSDTSILAMRIEALAGLGRLEEAEAMLEAAGDPAKDFFLVTSKARVLIERGDVAGALDAFARAARLAHDAGAPAFEAWANLRIAEQLIDSGDAAKAPPFVAAARRLAPPTHDLEVHEAELEAAQGRPADALARVEALLAKRDDPFLHAAAVPLAREAGRPDAAKRHHEAAERTFTAVVAHGEIYTLEALARLYADDGANPARALEIARRNFEHKRDASARILLEKAGRAARASSAPAR